MGINATLLQTLTVVETPDSGDLPSAASASITHSAFNQRKKISANTGADVPGSLVYGVKNTGTLNLDLTDLVGTFETEDGAGLKVQAIQVNNLSTTDELVISDGVLEHSGAPAPYSLNGGDDITVTPGGSINHFYNDKLADIAAGAKAIDFTPGSGEQFELIIVVG